MPTSPVPIERRALQGLTITAAGLAGFGLILWIAAYWDTLGRVGQFALLQSGVVAACALAWREGAARPAAGLLALLGIGGLFAFFGQTYQTGADAWQLFALWAALGVPLAVGVRSDVVWAPWTLVALVGTALWVQAHTGHRWQVNPTDLSVHLIGWTAALAVCALSSPPGRRWLGTGVWALRTGATLAVVMVSASALDGLFHSTVLPHYALGLLVLAGAAGLLAPPKWFDVFALSAVALGLDTLLVAGLARLIFDSGGRGEPIGRLLLIGLCAAGLLAASVSVILKLARRATSPEGQA
ncbi:DUF2157 domain-containing protein [Sphaerotilus sp.]|uniref:DUF2157 domain-containing protein n=1 Tax=Sphaerotilus sp. TaxID=2093942 RepID=UPI002ACD787F|nr:DUF2157 domain-containing protein [Sphaerotilus sp.]MDZ7858776.1 DUF2157 domain-containing protein [Sphaerotilus sp.]